MRKKGTSIIMSMVIILIATVSVLFGIIVFEGATKIEKRSNELKTSSELNKDEEISKKIEKSNVITEEIKTTETVKNENQKDPLEEIVNEQKQETIKEVQNENTSINKYYYNQLENYEKTLYRAFESNKENMKTGNYKIEFGNTFDSVLKEENGQDLLGKYYQSALEAYTYDNPDVFYLDPNKMYLNIETTKKWNNVTYNVFIDNGKNNNYLINEFSSKAQVDSALNEIEQEKENIIKNKKNSTYANIKMVHDYLVENIEYDTTLAKPNTYNMYGALVKKECVCEGYARSFKYLMDNLEIPCVIIIGKATNSKNKTEIHAWDYVELNGIWYAIDCTWDDPISETGIVSMSSKSKYFLKGKETMEKDHEPNSQFSNEGKIFEYPNLSTYDY